VTFTTFISDVHCIVFTVQQYTFSKVKWHNGANTYKNVSVSLLYKITLDINDVKDNCRIVPMKIFCIKIMLCAIQVQCTVYSKGFNFYHKVSHPSTSSVYFSYRD